MFRGRRPPSLAALCARAAVVSVESTSKVAWGGLRVGWLRADVAFLERTITERAHSDFGTSVPSQLLALRLLGQYDDLVEQRRESLRLVGDDLHAPPARRVPPLEGSTPRRWPLGVGRHRRRRRTARGARATSRCDGRARYDCVARCDGTYPPTAVLRPAPRRARDGRRTAPPRVRGRDRLARTVTHLARDAGAAQVADEFLETEGRRPLHVSSGAIHHRGMGFANRVVCAVLESPAHRLLSGSTDVIRYRGQRSGLTSRPRLSTPSRVMAWSSWSDGPRPRPGGGTSTTSVELDLLIRGRWLPMTGRAVVGADEPETMVPLLDAYLGRFPKAARHLGGATRESQARHVVVVWCRPR